MLIALIAISVLFLAMPFIVTERSAPYLLSGYNMLSRAEQQKVDITSYLVVFKKFHFFLGSSCLGFGLAIYFFAGPTWMMLFFVLFPLAAYFCFLVGTMRFFSGALKTQMWVGIVILALIMIFVGYLFADGLGKNTLLIKGQTIVIEGNYGEAIATSEIASIEWVDQLPKLDSRTNGFSTGDVKKGYFKTAEGERVKLFMHSRHTPAIQIKKKSGERIFYSIDDQTNQTLFQDLAKTFPQVVH